MPIAVIAQIGARSWIVGAIGLHAVGGIPATSGRHLGYDCAVVIGLVIIVAWTGVRSSQGRHNRPVMRVRLQSRHRQRLRLRRHRSCRRGDMVPATETGRTPVWKLPPGIATG